MAIPLRASSDPSDSAATCNYLDGGAVDSTAIVPGMDAFTPVVTLHAVAATYVLLLGPLQILRRRRDLAHRIVGLSWLIAMVTVCLSSFWIAAIGGIRRGNVPVHRGFMIGSYLGTLMAFAFAALVPARLIPQLLNSRPLIAVVTVAAVGAVAAIFHLATVRVTAAGKPRRPATVVVRDQSIGRVTS